MGLSAHCQTPTGRDIIDRLITLWEDGRVEFAVTTDGQRHAVRQREVCSAVPPFVIITSTFGSRCVYGKNSATRASAGMRGGAGVRPVVDPVMTSMPASARSVGVISQDKSLLSTVPCVASTTGLSESGSDHQKDGPNVSGGVGMAEPTRLTTPGGRSHWTPRFPGRARCGDARRGGGRRAGVRPGARGSVVGGGVGSARHTRLGPVRHRPWLRCDRPSRCRIGKPGGGVRPASACVASLWPHG